MTSPPSAPPSRPVSASATPTTVGRRHRPRRRGVRCRRRRLRTHPRLPGPARRQPGGTVGRRERGQRVGRGAAAQRSAPARRPRRLARDADQPRDDRRVLSGPSVKRAQRCRSSATLPPSVALPATSTVVRFEGRASGSCCACRSMAVVRRPRTEPGCSSAEDLAAVDGPSRHPDDSQRRPSTASPAATPACRSAGASTRPSPHPIERDGRPRSFRRLVPARPRAARGPGADLGDIDDPSSPIAPEFGSRTWGRGAACDETAAPIGALDRPTTWAGSARASPCAGRQTAWPAPLTVDRLPPRGGRGHRRARLAARPAALVDRHRAPRLAGPPLAVLAIAVARSARRRSPADVGVSRMAKRLHHLIDPFDRRPRWCRDCWP